MRCRPVHRIFQRRPRVTYGKIVAFETLVPTFNMPRLLLPSNDIGSLLGKD